MEQVYVINYPKKLLKSSGTDVFSPLLTASLHKKSWTFGRGHTQSGLRGQSQRVAGGVVTIPVSELAVPLVTSQKAFLSFLNFAQ